MAATSVNRKEPKWDVIPGLLRLGNAAKFCAAGPLVRSFDWRKPAARLRS